MIELGKLIQGLSYSEYEAEPGLRASDLRMLKRSPAHWRAAKENPKKPTDALLFGRAIHAALENGEKFIETYAVEPEVNRRTNEGKAQIKEFYDKLPRGAIVVKPEWVDPIKGMLLKMREHRLVGNMIRHGTREGSLWVKDPETGLTLKCKPDLITSRNHLVDFKSTIDASEEAFMHCIFSGRKYFYSLQLAHYCHCLKLAGLSSGESATIIAIEKKEPYGINIFPLDVGHLEVGEKWRRMLTKTYAMCLESGKWPSYPEQAVHVSIPQYVQYMEEEEA